MTGRKLLLSPPVQFSLVLKPSGSQEADLCLFCVAYILLTGMADESLFDFLHMEIVSQIYKEQQSGKEEMDNKDRAVCVSVLESMGFRVGQGLIERLTRDSPSFKDELDVMKFVCKDFWTKVFRRQVDNLRTNHQGTYVLQDNTFSLLTQLSNGKQYLDQAPKYLAFSCGIVRGALSSLGLDSVVTAEVSVMPSCKFQVVVQKL
ncbi:trafficking protein particle complex subunit 6B, like isoform X1 [Pungitius pungitius]|uniref:trafficking protein particle complex subunit 6B, like isoform X1 n=2 Tax=Pungitius pungitius TaxID=134920 RepID=UPI002E119DF1